MKLNHADLLLLDSLQRDAGRTHQELGQEIGRDASGVTRRIARFRQAGLIKGFHAAINPVQVGLPTTVFTLVALKQHSDNRTDRFQELMDTWPNVVECSKLSSSWDYLIKFVVRDTTQHDKLHHELLQLPDVSRVRGMHVIGQPRTKQLPLDLSG